MRAMNEVVLRFGSMEDPEVKGMSCLQQYEAQIGMVVKTGCGSDNPRLTIRACETMTSLIRLGVSRDPVAVKRMISKLLPKHASVEELQKKNDNRWAEHVETEILLHKLKALSILYLVMSGELTNLRGQLYDNKIKIRKNDAFKIKSLLPFWISAVHDRMQLKRGTRTLMLISADVITTEIEKAFEEMWTYFVFASCVSSGDECVVLEKEDRALLTGAAALTGNNAALMLALLFRGDEEEEEEEDVQMEVLDMCVNETRALRIVLEKLLTKKCQDPKILKCICCGKYDEDVEMFRTAVQVVKNNKECIEAMLMLALQFAWKKEDVRYVQVYVEEVSVVEVNIDLKTLEE